jgi:hypothetical protein
VRRRFVSSRDCEIVVDFIQREKETDDKVEEFETAKRNPTAAVSNTLLYKT